jgi:hypothetical protein
LSKESSDVPTPRPVPELLSLPAADLLAWVEAHRDQADGDDSDWQDLAYGCGIEAGVGRPADRATFAAAAARLDDRLAATSSSPVDRDRLTQRAMGWRAFLIATEGPCPGDDLRDPAVLETWFFDRLDVPQAEALAMAAEPDGLSTDDFLRLARLRDRVDLVRHAGLDRHSSRGAEIAAWYSLAR